MGIPDFQKLDKWEDANKTKVFLPQASVTVDNFDYPE
jgi:hypothetical protein